MFFSPELVKTDMIAPTLSMKAVSSKIGLAFSGTGSWIKLSSKVARKRGIWRDIWANALRVTVFLDVAGV